LTENGLVAFSILFFLKLFPEPQQTPLYLIREEKWGLFDPEFVYIMERAKLE
jgi:hypothetical protein